MADYPDVYADGITITVNPLGIAVTFTRSDPATPGVTETEGRDIVARARLPRQVAEGLQTVLQQALALPGKDTKSISH